MEHNKELGQPAQAYKSPHESTKELHVEADTVYKGHQLKLKKRSSFWNVASKLFVWELLAMCLSTGLLLAIIVILSSYNHRPQPTWGYISLNSLISWLSTISKGCVLFAISESLGQLKWLWFTHNSRAMSDLRTFDAASRGLFGSAALIWDLRARHFAVPGSLAVILAIAFDPFTQNLLHSYPKLTPDASQIAIVSNNSVYDVVGPQLGLDGEAYVDPTLKANVYNSLFNNDASKPWSIPNYTCGTGNCTWNPITSLGMRAVCSDVTKYLHSQCHTITNDTSDLAMVGERNCSIHLRFNSSTSTISANYIENGPVATAVVAGPGGISIIQEDSPFYHVQLIAPDQSIEEVDVFTNSTKWQAMECALQPIVRRFRPSVTGGIYREDTISVWKNRSVNQDLNGYSLSPPWGPEMGIEQNTTFMITFEAIRAMDPFMYFFAGSVESALGRITFIPVEGYATYASADFMQAIAVSNITGCTATGSERLRCAMENAAAAMSKTFRDSTPSATYSQDANSSTLGHAMSNTTYVTVHWQWISLPVLVWLLGIVTLVGTMLRSRRAVVPTWKNDLMPLLFIYEGGQDEQLASDGKLENDKRVRLYDFKGRVVLGE